MTEGEDHDPALTRLAAPSGGSDDLCGTELSGSECSGAGLRGAELRGASHRAFSGRPGANARRDRPLQPRRAHHGGAATRARPPGKVPAAFALFPADISRPPREWAERFFNVQRWTEMPRGGHFAAMEEPALLAEDIRAWFRPFRA